MVTLGTGNAWDSSMYVVFLNREKYVHVKDFCNIKRYEEQLVLHGINYNVSKSMPEQ